MRTIKPPIPDPNESNVIDWIKGNNESFIPVLNEDCFDYTYCDELDNDNQ